MPRSEERQERVETLLSEIELLIASERLQLQFDNARLARAILALSQLGIIEEMIMTAKDGLLAQLIPKE